MPPSGEKGLMAPRTDVHPLRGFPLERFTDGEKLLAEYLGEPADSPGYSWAAYHSDDLLAGHDTPEHSRR